MNEELKVKLLTMLNRAFEMEYNDVFLYLKEADAFKKMLVNKINVSDTFRQFSQQELRHADILSARIITLGGKARWDFGTLNPAKSIGEILKKHMDAETNAYFLYGEILKIAEDEALAQEITDIRGTEKAHLDKLTEIVKALRDHRSSENDEVTGYEYLDDYTG